MWKAIRGLASLVSLALLTSCGGGSSGSSPSATQVADAGLHVRALAAGNVSLQGGQIHASLNGTVRLDGSNSTDDDHDTLSYQWTLISQPTGGNAPASGTGAALEWQPNALGAYTYALKVSDPRGASSTQNFNVMVDNTALSANVVVAVQRVGSSIPPGQQISLGTNIVLDASGGTTTEGAASAVSFTLTQRPAGSNAALTLGDKTARFSPDVLGTYMAKASGTDASGIGFETNYTFWVSNEAPKPIIIASATDLTAGAISAVAGYDVLMNAAATSNGSSALSYGWQLSAKPAGSSAALNSATGPTANFSPDLLGDYVVTLTATSTTGKLSTYTTTVHVANRRPVANIVAGTAPSAGANVPSFLLPLGTQVTLRGDTSTDPDGDSLTYAWSINSRPSSSNAQLSSATAVSPTFVPDQEGSYVFTLRVTDPSGAYGERQITLQVGGHAPAVVLDTKAVTGVIGSTVPLSAALSFDDDGDALSYQWSVTSAPTGSAALPAAAGSASTSFSGDVAGSYVLSVAVSDGRRTSVAPVAVTVLPPAIALNNLTLPAMARYSRSLDRFVMLTSAPGVAIVDPATGAVSTVALPSAPNVLNLSPDGKLAVAVRGQAASLIDVSTATILGTVVSTDYLESGVVTNGGVLWLFAEEDVPYTHHIVLVADGHTGNFIPQQTQFDGAEFVGYPVLADRYGKIFLRDQDYTPPANLVTFNFDTATNQGLSRSDARPAITFNNEVFLAEDQSFLMTGFGWVYDSQTLADVGRVDGVASVSYTEIISFSHSLAMQESLALIWNQNAALLPTTYARYDMRYGFYAQDYMALPYINGVPSYGIKVFHSSTGRHVMFVQTGSANRSDTAGVNYYLVRR
ncbi:REJ domain-containing protein [Paucibacter sp. R3-3]|uniref:REJ domain-containing protein n=1 Tax=Roseateles agri TaxID=3098619 RepID=A0ABU5DJ48_9BURK|nr:REJ domain-containing protein [Paucibacter sp. R3-3]MDY0745758.1 REJ domain-containing protein [Paucibacter sp. R3-3]